VSLLFSAKNVQRKRIFFEEPKKSQLKGSVALDYDGTPFVMSSTTCFACQQGKPRKAKVNVSADQEVKKSQLKDLHIYHVAYI